MDKHNDTGAAEGLSETELEALHELQLGKENLHKAHGNLIKFHHKIGRGMGHYDTAVDLLREEGHDDLADNLQNGMAMGVIEGRWSWSIVDEFEEFFLPTNLDAEADIRTELTDDSRERHINERLLENKARDRSQDED